MPSTPYGLDRETARTLMASTVLAPSSHNTQPWAFRPRNGGIDLLADRTRALPVNDPEDRELTISCGCALFNLRLAAAHEQVPLRITLLPDGVDQDRLAAVEMASSGPVPAELAALCGALTLRRTYRKTFVDASVPPAQVAALSDTATSESAWLQTIESDSARHAIAALVAEGDAIQWAMPSWRRELAQWMYPRRHGDGLSLPGLVVPVAQAVVRGFDMGHGVGAKAQQLADASPLLAVLGTEADGPEDWLLAGQRARLQHLIGQSGFPQILLRLGYPIDPVPATPRRPLESVIDNP